LNWLKTFVQLDKRSHDRKSFDCEEDEPNIFFQERAAKYMELHLSATWVLPATTAIHGKYPVPVQLIAQMGVHKEEQGKGFGKITLVKALQRLRVITKQLPATAVVVDCLNDEFSQFYERYGFEYLYQHDGRKRLFLPTKKLEYL